MKFAAIILIASVAALKLTSHVEEFNSDLEAKKDSKEDHKSDHKEEAKDHSKKEEKKEGKSEKKEAKMITVNDPIPNEEDEDDMHWASHPFLLNVRVTTHNLK